MSQPPKFQTAPIITTERLILRAFKYDDFTDYTAMFQDPVFTRYTSVQPLSREDAWAKMVRHAGIWSFLGYSNWAIEKNLAGSLSGRSVFPISRDPSPPPLRV